MEIYRCQRHNRPVKLTTEVGQGGEATVWRTDFKGYVAKIYEDSDSEEKREQIRERIEKLQLMVKHIPADPNAHLNHISFTWPYSILEDQQGEMVGYLMPEVVGSETLLKVCTPRLRRQLKLETNWYFLHVVARNVAGIIQAIHAKGYVLGDIKLENILVNNQALPTIIDTDSFQVPDPYSLKIHRCLVASEGFTPAELIGVDIASVDQTEVHDRFRLGVVIYYLLFGGPPFQGIWQGSGEQPEQAELIQRGLWPFSSDSLIVPSQITMPLDILHPELKDCFLHCFNDGHQFPHKRPTAGDWLRVLEKSLNEVVVCGKVDNHFYSRSYGHCYWCDRASSLNFDLFPGSALVPVNPSPPPTQPANRGTKTSAPKAPSRPKQLPPKWSRRKVLAGLGLVTVGGVGSVAGIKIFAQPRSGNLVSKEPSPSSKIVAKPPSFVELLPNGVELEMVGLGGGTFFMGSPESDPGAYFDDEFPQHEVTVPSFAIGKYPVTQAQWQAVMGNNPSRFDNDPENPVESVSWGDCQKFCQKVSEFTGRKYRLPSEAEWEYACRARTRTRYYFGDSAYIRYYYGYTDYILKAFAWFAKNSGGVTHHVGQKKPNPWGLYDMYGNVDEWCEDKWHSNYDGAPTDGSAWSETDSIGHYRVTRGGSWRVMNEDCFRSADRSLAQSPDSDLGLRLVLGSDNNSHFGILGQFY